MTALGSVLVVNLQLRLMDVAGEAQTIGAALNHASLNIANAAGAWLGGLVIAAGFGYRVDRRRRRRAGGWRAFAVLRRRGADAATRHTTSGDTLTGGVISASPVLTMPRRRSSLFG